MKALDDGLVSVVVPAFNDASTISDTLESLLAQRYERWEAIVVDDGSTDDTARLIASYAQKDSRFQLLGRINGGPSAARNTGIAKAKGEFLMFLDADDVFRPNTLQKLVRGLSRNPQWDAVHCGWWQTRDVSQPPGGRCWCSFTGDLFDELCQRNLMPICAVMIRRRVMEAVAGFDESLSAVEDWDLWLQIARTGARFGRIADVLCLIRVRPGSNTQGSRRVFDCSWALLDRAHAADSRVSRPDPRHANGADASRRPIAITESAWACLGLAAGQGDFGTADYILGRVAHNYPDSLIPEQIGEGMRSMIWRGALIDEGQWEKLWPRISAPLLEFLLKQERNLARPGFGSEVLAHFAGLGLLNRVLQCTSYKLGRTITGLKFW